MKLRLLFFLVLAFGISSCRKPASSALSPADEKRLTELRELEERAAQRDAEAKMAQLEADRQKLEADQAALEEEKRQLAAERAAAQNDPQRQAQYLQSERRIQEREAAQRAAEERAAAAERAAEKAREAHEEKRAAAAKKIDFFYDALDPLGDWMQVDPYGYVWQPREAHSHGWRPYTDGTWVYTDYGWTWKGNEPFGWATYHYGRWTRLQDRGWVWVPGSEWAPAWVSWRKSPDYVGWAPLPPEAHSSNGFNGAVDSYYDIGPGSYNFVPARSLGEPSYRNVVIEPERNHTIIIETSNVTRMNYANYGREPVYYNEGPDYDELSRYGGRPVPRYRLERESSREHFNGSAAAAVAGNVLRMLAPQIAPAPRAVATPPRVSARLGVSAPDHGWGTGGNGQGFRAKAQQEATQAEQIARTQPAATPFIRSGWRPSGGPGGNPSKPLTGPFGTGPTPQRSGTTGNWATPPRNGPPATPAHTGTPGLSTPPRFGPAGATPRVNGLPPTTPRPVIDTEPLSTPRPELSTPVPRPNNHATPTPPRGKGPKPFNATPRPAATPLDDPTPVRPQRSTPLPMPSTPEPTATPRPIKPTTPSKRDPVPRATPVDDPTPVRLVLSTPRQMSSAPDPATTPRPLNPTPPSKRDPSALATPKLKPAGLEGTGLGGENATPTRATPSATKATPVRIEKPTPPPDTRATPPPPPVKRATPVSGPPAPPVSRPTPPTVTRPATGGGGTPVIPSATPRRVPMANPDGGADPRKTLPPPPTSKPSAQATPAGSPTPPKKKP